MKKILFLFLIGTVAVLSFADDALVLPKGVLRLSQTTAFAFANSEFNLDGQTVQIPETQGRLRVLSLGGSIEYGITNWLSAAIQWDPGWNVWSAYDFQTSPSNMLTANGSYDIFTGLRVQVLGEKGLLASERIRLAFTPGGKIPLPSPNWEEQITRRTNGETWVLKPNDYHTPALGGRASFDYVLNRMFYLNLYGEFLYYFPKAFEEAELLAYLSPSYQKVEYGYELTAEAEPHFEFQITEGLRIRAGIPLTYMMTPELKFDDDAVAGSNTYLLTLAPNISLLLGKLPMILEVGLGYTVPLLGKGLDVPAMNELTLQLKSYLRLFK